MITRSKIIIKVKIIKDTIRLKIKVKKGWL